jgi:hypothetical protein
MGNSIKGKATGGSATTIIDATKNFETDVVKDKLVSVVVNGIKYIRKITGNAIHTLTILALRAAVAASAVVKAASAPTDTLTIAAAAGSPGNQLSVLLTTAADDTLAVTKTDGTKTINIALAKTTATKNTATLIQAAVRALGTVGGISVAAATCTAAGNWNTAAVATGEAGAVKFTDGVDAIAVSADDEYEVFL